MILNSSESLAKPLVMAKLNMAHLSSLKNQINCCRYDDFKFIRITCQTACHGKTEHGILVKFKKPANLRSSYLPVSLSRVLRAPGTSPYHLVLTHLRTTWSRPEQSHLHREACSPNGTDKRRQRQRQTERPLPEPSDILKRFCALFDDELSCFIKKFSKLYCSYNSFNPNDSIWSHWILDEIWLKNRSWNGWIEIN